MRNQESTGDWAVPTCVILAVLSLVPVLPFAAWSLIHWLFVPRKLVLHGRVIPVESFSFWYASLCVLFVTLATLMIFIDNKRTKEREQQIKQGLDAPAMRFALCYSIVQEVDRYTKNRIPKHVERAIEYWGSFIASLRSLFDRLDLSDIAVVRHRIYLESDIDGSILMGRYLSVLPDVDSLRQSYPWFKVEPSTAKVINAFNGLQLRIPGRLKDKKDLPQVAKVLDNLAKYLYSAIPELSSGERNGRNLQALGERALMEFAEEAEKLPQYREEQRPLASKEKVSRKLVGAFGWSVRLFSHENLLVRFCTWWGFAQALVLVVLRIAFQSVPNLKLDSNLIVFAGGTPLLVAAAALAGAIRKK